MAELDAAASEEKRRRILDAAFAVCEVRGVHAARMENRDAGAPKSVAATPAWLFVCGAAVPVSVIEDHLGDLGRALEQIGVLDVYTGKN